MPLQLADGERVERGGSDARTRRLPQLLQNRHDDLARAADARNLCFAVVANRHAAATVLSVNDARRLKPRLRAYRRKGRLRGLQTPETLARALVACAGRLRGCARASLRRGFSRQPYYCLTAFSFARIWRLTSSMDCAPSTAISLPCRA